MPVKLQKENALKSIPVRNLESGVLAEIVEFPDPAYLGMIVQRTSTTLFVIGNGAKYWADLDRTSDEFRVRPLAPGELLRVTQ